MPEQAQTLWSDYPLNGWLVLFTIIIMLASLNSFINLFPYLIKTLFDWKANIRLESSIPRLRTRNFISVIMVLPFCLVAGRYSLITMNTFDIVPPSLSIVTVFGVTAAFLLLKLFMYVLLLPRNHTRGCFKAALSSEPNTFIMLVIVELFTTGILTLLQVGDDTARTVIYYELGVFYLLMIAQKGQILSSAYSPFSTFLYLCGLEILPAAVLIVANLKF